MVGTLFRFGNIHQSLIVYLFIHGFFINIMLLLSNIYLENIIFYFGYGLLKNKPKHP